MLSRTKSPSGQRHIPSWHSLPPRQVSPSLHDIPGSTASVVVFLLPKGSLLPYVNGIQKPNRLRAKPGEHRHSPPTHSAPDGHWLEARQLRAERDSQVTNRDKPSMGLRHLSPTNSNPSGHKQKPSTQTEQLVQNVASSHSNPGRATKKN